MLPSSNHLHTSNHSPARFEGVYMEDDVEGKVMIPQKAKPAEIGNPKSWALEHQTTKTVEPPRGSISGDNASMKDFESHPKEITTWEALVITGATATPHEEYLSEHHRECWLKRLTSSR
ncbi:hypothetical protein AMTR_s00138p00051880 [Amborella trichopoda]|uniref:Uncharacterized protein n=1 Tax=Amborella trichopoda TaxID=13333 RepID=W1NDP6_AMBTC|nr:hypothetical protein AMTR_s00138p00051880 [Amborella trichopoda]